MLREVQSQCVEAWRGYVTWHTLHSYTWWQRLANARRKLHSRELNCWAPGKRWHHSSLKVFWKKLFIIRIELVLRAVSLSVWLSAHCTILYVYTYVMYIYIYILIDGRLILIDQRTDTDELMLPAYWSQPVSIFLISCDSVHEGGISLSHWYLK